MKIYKLFIISITIFLMYSCDVLDQETYTADVIRQDGKILIKDRTGKLWDITHAVNEYNFDPNIFAHGLGPFAITPIQNPQMLSPGDPDYPDKGNGTVVLGTIFNDEARAYPLGVLINHEIANEKFGRTHVSVAY